MPARISIFGLCIFAVLAATFAGCTAKQEHKQTIAHPALDATAGQDYPGVHNIATYAPNVLSGSAPEGDEGFETLASLGIKTIISVDGALPEVEKAKAHGLRYIHLPIQYSGIEDQRKLEIARALDVSLERGPVYIHCHHGKHRSSGATATALVQLGVLSSDAAVEKMKISKCSSKYEGLYEAARTAKPVDPMLLESLGSTFPERSPLPGFVQSMVEIDILTEKLIAIEKAGWKAPADHPDLVPAAEAGLLADLYLHLKDDKQAKAKPADFMEMMDHAATASKTLEDAIVAGESPELLTKKWNVILQSCTDCHTIYRNKKK